jgi:hypothetical protein
VIRLAIVIPLSLCAAAQETHNAQATTLRYNAEWRLGHAGTVELVWQPSDRPQAGTAQLHLESAGIVARLYKISNDYRVSMTEGYCAVSAAMQIREGERKRETEVVYDRSRRHAFFEERDLVKNTAAKKDVPLGADCVHDTVGALMAMRSMVLPIGQSASIPVSDGRKFAQVKVEAQQKETVRTPAGVFPAIRYEAFLMNNVIYGRNGRVYVWLSDDERRLPVQIQVRLQILIGTITLQLTKEEKR